MLTQIQFRAWIYSELDSHGGQTGSTVTSAGAGTGSVSEAKSSASELGKKLLLRRQKNLAKEEEEK